MPREQRVVRYLHLKIYNLLGQQKCLGKVELWATIGLKKIMIVEDNELNIKLLNDILEKEGYETICVDNGWDTIPSVNDNNPDIIILDIRLPGRSGFDILKAIKSEDRTKKIPVIVVTAFASHDDECKAKSLGCSAFVSKPIRVQELIEKVKLLA